jgi:hypothetical protein
METFYLLLLIPIIWAFVAKRLLHTTISWREMGLQVLASSAIVAGVFFTGKYSQTHDVEIWNGQIESKHRDHGHYIESYECNCYESCSGTGANRTCHRVCQTCYRDHYTVKWYLNTTIGEIGLQYLDRTSRSVYNTPDPAQYTAAYVSEPCSREFSFTNYVKAVPESLFNKLDAKSLAKFDSMIPAYPRVHSYYKVNRVIPVGVKVPNVAEWNLRLSEHLRNLGPRKEANIIVVIANTSDQSYRYALERAWVGGKQNDVVVVIGATQFPNIDWVDTITFGQNAGNAMLAVQIRDNLMKVGTLEAPAPIIDTIAVSVDGQFKRKHMSDYEYLKDEIQPPMWVLILAFIFAIGASGGLTYYFHHEDMFGTDRRRYR